MNLEQALDELHRWEREAKRVDASNERLKRDLDYAIGLINMCREHFENIEAMADQWSALQAKIARLALDALPPKL